MLVAVCQTAPEKYIFNVNMSELFEAIVPQLSWKVKCEVVLLFLTAKQRIPYFLPTQRARERSSTPLYRKGTTMEELRGYGRCCVCSAS